MGSFSFTVPCMQRFNRKGQYTYNFFKFHSIVVFNLKYMKRNRWNGVFIAKIRDLGNERGEFGK
jgi:hypothetical protein